MNQKSPWLKKNHEKPWFQFFWNVYYDWNYTEFLKALYFYCSHAILARTSLYVAEWQHFNDLLGDGLDDMEYTAPELLWDTS